ncbi:MAG: hypothetical protein ACP5UA_07005 [Candidatus Hydrogenedens sp.]
MLRLGVISLFLMGLGCVNETYKYNSPYVIWEWRLGPLKEFKEGIFQKEIVEFANLFIKEFSFEKEDISPFLYSKYFADGDIYITLIYVRDEQKRKQWQSLLVEYRKIDIPMYTDYIVTISLLTNRVVQFYNGGVLTSYSGNLHFSNSYMDRRLKMDNENNEGTMCVEKISEYIGIPEEKRTSVEIFKSPLGFLYFKSKEKSFNILSGLDRYKSINDFYFGIVRTLYFDLGSLDNEDRPISAPLFEGVLICIKDKWYPLFYIYNF